LGYEGRVYKEGEDVAVSTPAEVKRLMGYRVIMAGDEEVLPEKDVTEVANPPKTLYSERNQTRSRKKK
jgi:hypothetical protein